MQYKTKLVVAYHKNDEKNWKFLCLNNGKSITIMHDYNKRRKDQFKDCAVTSDNYIIRDATQDEIDEAMVDRI